jgi:1-deoxy-D-xylulose-5-phosphate synthase
MLIHDVAISGTHVVFAVDRAGLVSGDGETHQGVFDVAYLCSIPGMTVYSPASFAELRDMLRYAVESVAGPVAVRFPRGGEGAYKYGGSDRITCVREGKDFTLVTYGESVNTAVEAAANLSHDGISIEIIKLGCICPIDFEAIFASVAKTGRLLVLEECAGRGSIGEHIAASLAQSNIFLERVILMNTGDAFAPCGGIEDLRKLCGIDVESVSEKIREELRQDSGEPGDGFGCGTKGRLIDCQVTSIFAETGARNEQAAKSAASI